MSAPGRGRVNRPRFRRCVNCSLSLGPNFHRRLIEELDEPMLILLRSWVTPTPISSDDIVCVECFLLLENRTSSATISSVSPALGHVSICFACGISIAERSRRTRRVSPDCPQRDVLLRWTPAHHVLHLERVCDACWAAASRELQKQPVGGDIRPNMDHGPSAPVTHIMDDNIADTVIPVPPPVPLAVPPPQDQQTQFQQPVQNNATARSKCLSQVSTTKEKALEAQIRSLIAKVYHYLEQEFEELKKFYEDLDLTPLSRISRRTAIATGVTEDTVLEILVEEAERLALIEEPPGKRSRLEDMDSTSDENNSDEDIERQMECALDEPRVYVDTCLKTEPNPLFDCDTETVVIKEEPQETTYNIELDSRSTLHMVMEPKVEDSNLNNSLADNDSNDETVPRNKEKSISGPVGKTSTKELESISAANPEEVEQHSEDVDLNTSLAGDFSDDDEIISRTKEKTKPGPMEKISKKQSTRRKRTVRRDKITTERLQVNLTEVKHEGIDLNEDGHRRILMPK